MVTVTSLHVPEMAILGMQELPITEEEAQMGNGTNAVTEMAMTTVVTGNEGPGIMKKMIVTIITEATGTILTGMVTRRFFSSGGSVMTGINFGILEGRSSWGLYYYYYAGKLSIVVLCNQLGNISI